MSTNDDNNDQQCNGGGEETLSTKECTSSEQNNVDTITDGIDRVALLDNVSTCACCGKEGNSDDMNTCNKCKMVKYCATQHAKRNTEQNIKRPVREEWRSYMMNNYSKKSSVRSVQSVYKSYQLKMMQ